MESTFANIALERERQIDYAKTTAVVNAIISVGNAVVSAVTGSAGSSDGDKLKKTMDNLRNLMLPELAEKAERDAGRVKTILEREASQGPITLTPMAHKKSKRRKKNSARG